MKRREDFRTRGSGSIFLRGNIFWVRYYRSGQGYSESTHSNSKTKAIAMLKARLAEVETGTFNPERGKIRVSDLMDAVFRNYEEQKQRSIDQAKGRWNRHLKDEFGHLLAANVTSDMLERYVQKRQSEKPEPEAGSLNRELALLKRAFSLGMQSTPPKVRFMIHAKIPAVERGQCSHWISHRCGGTEDQRGMQQGRTVYGRAVRNSGRVRFPHR